HAVAVIVGNRSLRTEIRWTMIRPRTHASEPRKMAILLYPSVQSLNVTGPLEVFTGARELLASGMHRQRSYEIRTFSRDGAPLRTSSGLTLTPDARVAQAPAELRTLLVPGGHGSRQAVADAAL